MALENKPNDRLFDLMTYVDSSSVKSLIMDIYKINIDDDLKIKEFKEFKREPIKIMIHSYGGSVYDGFALINAINQSKTEIHGFCIGNAFSMGLYILISCHKKYMYKYSTIMYHEAGNLIDGSITKLKENINEAERLQKLLDEIILTKSNISIDQLEKIKLQKQDWFITPNAALSLNLIDEII